ncbi:MAG: glycerol-3-phosphate dehydrogenase/oxidase [Chloroflexota bacterium]
MAQNRLRRGETWQLLEQTAKWDVIVIGGGITGAGILREAARAGLRALLVEQRDFAWGTSSRSSKLVHGGLRYLKQGQIGLTYQSVRERQNLLEVGAGLVTRLGFLMPTYNGEANKLTYQIGLSLYDLMAMRWGNHLYSATDFAMLVPRISDERLDGGLAFEDAQTDDARLVLRVLQEAQNAGGVAINYVQAEQLLKEDHRVCGVQVREVASGQIVALHAHVVINATGAWVDQLRADVGGTARIRPLRGSHLIFPGWRFPVAQAISFLHPTDQRPVFVYPWEGVTLVGTTDLDHEHDLNEEPHISGEEVAYLLAACDHHFPSLSLQVDDILATYAGVRPVINTGKSDPSKEGRDHVVWLEEGLLSVTGGKLTTFRVIALDALKTAKTLLPNAPIFDTKAPTIDPVDTALPAAANRLTLFERTRLLGRYGARAANLIHLAHPDELQPIAGTQTLWAELCWAAHAESVVHLDDLLLRRTRLGLVLPHGGLAYIDRIRAMCEPELDWDADRWEQEIARYWELWQRYYGIPSTEHIPEWRTVHPTVTADQHTSTTTKWPYAVGIAAAVLALLALWRRMTRPHRLTSPSY